MVNCLQKARSSAVLFFQTPFDFLIGIMTQFGPNFI